MSSKSRPVMCLEILWHALMPCLLQSTPSVYPISVPLVQKSEYAYLKVR
jgi:hypothetical protein